MQQLLDKIIGMGMIMIMMSVLGIGIYALCVLNEAIMLIEGVSHGL